MLKRLSGARNQAIESPAIGDPAPGFTLPDGSQGEVSLQAFAGQHRLGFPLLSDFEPKGAVARLYQVYNEERGVAQRALFLVDGDGIIRWRHVSPPNINPGADGILNALQDLDAS